MRRNPWFKLAGVSLVALLLSFVLLWGVGQYNQYRFYNGYGNMNMQYMNGNYNMPMGGMRNNMYNNMYMNGNMNMQGGMNMNVPMGNMNGNMNIQGGMNMPMMNMNGSSNMQGSGMGMMGGM